MGEGQIRPRITGSGDWHSRFDVERQVGPFARAIAEKSGRGDHRRIVSTQTWWRAHNGYLSQFFDPLKQAAVRSYAAAKCKATGPEGLRCPSHFGGQYVDHGGLKAGCQVGAGKFFAALVSG